MSRASSSESARIEVLQSIFAPHADRRLLLGIGDDAAVLEGSGEPLVWSIDVQVEHVHFERRWLSAADVGYRATMAAASDLAAMGAEPRGVLASVVLPRDGDDELLRGIATGQAEACRELGTAMAGGNLSAGAELSVATTVLGQAARPLRRAGAEVGHEVWLAGPVGRAAAGLAWLRSAPPDEPLPSAPLDGMVRAFRRPVARIEPGRQAAGWASAAIDVSDGLACDLARLVRAARPSSPGLQLQLERDALADPLLGAACQALDRDPVALALHGGEDFALAVTAPPGAAAPGFVRIGRCVAAPPDAPLLVVDDPDGSLVPVSTNGFDHFR